MKVEIKCEGSERLDLDDLQEFQGELKSLSKINYEKLKKEILELGFSAPIHVWKNKGVNNILDGTQRTRTLKQMRSEGFEIPSLPIVEVKAKSKKEAKKKLLALASQYGKVERQGLYEFMTEAELDIEDVTESFAFADVDLDSFSQEYFEQELREEAERVKKDLEEEKQAAQKSDPQKSPPSQKPQFNILVECYDEGQQINLLEELQMREIPCKLM